MNLIVCSPLAPNIAFFCGKTTPTSVSRPNPLNGDSLTRNARNVSTTSTEVSKKLSDSATIFQSDPKKSTPTLKSWGQPPLHGGCKLFDLISRPQITLTSIATEIPAFQHLLDSITEDRNETIEAAEVAMKYHGYIHRERALADKMQRLEAIKIRNRFEYDKLTQLSTEPSETFPNQSRDACSSRTNPRSLPQRHQCITGVIGKIAPRFT